MKIKSPRKPRCNFRISASVLVILSLIMCILRSQDVEDNQRRFDKDYAARLVDAYNQGITGGVIWYGNSKDQVVGSVIGGKTIIKGEEEIVYGGSHEYNAEKVLRALRYIGVDSKNRLFFDYLGQQPTEQEFNSTVTSN